MVEPIKPNEVRTRKKESIPDVVIEAFNELIVKNMSGRSSVVSQNDVLTILAEKGIDRHKVFDNGWLDIEDLYREAGWIVTYDKPGYNETYTATFEFRRKGK